MLIQTVGQFSLPKLFIIICKKKRKGKKEGLFILLPKT